MKRLYAALFAVAALAVAPSPARAMPVTLGVDLAIPEVVGLHAGFWLDPRVNLDLRLTLATVDAGVTGHLPLGKLAPESEQRHGLLFNLLGGYVHSGVHNSRLPYQSARAFAGVGWGTQGTFDVRVVGGISAAQYDQSGPSSSGWGVRPAGYLLVGYIF